MGIFYMYWFITVFIATGMSGQERILNPETSFLNILITVLLAPVVIPIRFGAKFEIGINKD